MESANCERRRRCAFRRDFSDTFRQRHLSLSPCTHVSLSLWTTSQPPPSGGGTRRTAAAAVFMVNHNKKRRQRSSAATLVRVGSGMRFSFGTSFDPDWVWFDR
ncbi:hypothetical protein Hanom_Chr09g00814161 [Helianthus anomalus]